MIAIEFHEPPQFKSKLAWRLMHKIDQSLFPQLVIVPMLSKHRILTQVAGHNMDVIKILPPLTIGEKEVDRFVKALDETLTECRRFPGPIMELAKNTAVLQLRNQGVILPKRQVRPAVAKLNGHKAVNGHNGHHGVNGTNGANGHAVNGAAHNGKNGHPVERQ